MIRKKIGKNIIFEFSFGVFFIEDINKYVFVVYCGVCMMNRVGMLFRIEKVKFFNVFIVNYGVLIVYVKGILERLFEFFNY